MGTSNVFYSWVVSKEFTYLTDLVRFFRSLSDSDFVLNSKDAEVADSTDIRCLLVPFADFVLDIIGAKYLFEERGEALCDFDFMVHHEDMMLRFYLEVNESGVKSVRVRQFASGCARPTATKPYSHAECIVVTQDALFFAVDDRIRLSASLETVILQQLKNGFSLDEIREQCLDCLEKLRVSKK